MSLKLKYAYIVVYAGIIFLALVLRFHNFYDTVSFRADHARDLYIARSFVEDGQPLYFGPLLSVESFNIPPAYYHLLALLYRFLRTPQGTTFAFACMNLLAMYCMTVLAARLIGKEAGVIMAFLFAVSSTMVSQSRMMWQPYPLTICIAASLLLLFESLKKKKLILFCLALLLYAYSISIYVTSVLLFPYYVYMGARFFKHSSSYPYALGILATLGSLILAALPFFAQYLSYERSLGFPSYVALQTPAFGAAKTFQQGWDMYIKYTVMFLEDMFQYRAIKIVDVAAAENYMNWAMIILLLTPRLFGKYFRGKFMNINHSVRFFFGLFWLLTGSIIILWFQKSQYSYRTHAFVPFFLLGFTYVLYLAVRSRFNIFSLLAGILLVVYTTGNMYSVLTPRINTPYYEVDRAAKVAHIIAQDAARSGVRPSDMGVGVSYNYMIYPFLYYLRDFANYALPYVHGGNTLDLRIIDYPNTHKYFYVICIQRTFMDISPEECDGNFLGQNPGYGKIAELPVNGVDVIMKYSMDAELFAKPNI